MIYQLSPYLLPILVHHPQQLPPHRQRRHRGWRLLALGGEGAHPQIGVLPCVGGCFFFLGVHVCIYIYVCVCVCMYVCVYDVRAKSINQPASQPANQKQK